MKKSLLYLCFLLASTTFLIGQNSDCYQGDDSNGIGPGRNITAGWGYLSADDFIVSANTTLTVNSFELNVYSPDPVSSLDVNFFDDLEGEPGELVLQLEDITPTYQRIVGSLYTMYIYRVIVNLETPISFEGGSNNTTFWFQPEATQENESMVFWEVTNSGSLGNSITTSEAGAPWSPYNQVDHGVFKISCDPIDEPAEEYCVPVFSERVEPISRVQFADIDNSSNPEINGSARIEYFLDMTANVESGESYEIALEGNTDGEFENYFTVFIDWNQNGILDDEGEIYEIGYIFASDGTDGEQAINEIEIPVDALEGTTRMRVMKRFNQYPVEACGAYGFGQAEDYTINVLPTIGIEDNNPSTFTYYPNPVQDKLNFSSTTPIKEIKIYNYLGKKINTQIDLESKSIDLSNYSSGIYLVKVSFKDGNEVQTFKVIKN